jgi:hypothetical protein
MGNLHEDTSAKGTINDYDDLSSYVCDHPKTCIFHDEDDNVFVAYEDENGSTRTLRVGEDDNVPTDEEPSWPLRPADGNVRIESEV